MLASKKGLSFYDEAGRPVLPQPRGDVSTGAWFGSEALKRNTVEKMEKHREQDQIVQGFYQAGLLTGDNDLDYGEFKGCLVGCTLPVFNGHWYDELVIHIADDPHLDDLIEDEGVWHLLVRLYYNIPVKIAGVLDSAFEDQFEDDAPEFAVRALETIPVGAVYSYEDIDAIQGWHTRGSEYLLELLATPSSIAGTVAA